MPRIFFFSLVSIPLLYTRFHDSITNIAPGNIDTFNHVIFLKDLGSIGFLSNPYYAPGFHLLLFPLTFLVPYADIYRFTGPALGMITILSIYLIFRNSFKNPTSSIVLLLLFAFPVYNQLTLQTIGFFSSSLTFIFITSFLFLTSQPKELSEKINLLFFFILSTALAVTVPYLFVQLVPLFFVILFLVLLLKKTFSASYKKFVFKIFLIIILGFIFSFTHVYIQTHILHPGTGFPEIPMVEEGSSSTGSNYAITHYTPPFLLTSPIARAYALPMYNIAFDVLRIKNIRQINNILSAGSYVWILISVGLLIFSIRKRERLLLCITLSSIVFGLATQTGTLEMSLYRGRSGWYLLFFSLLGVVFIFDRFYGDKFKKLFYAVSALLFVSAFASPPAFYRAYFTDTFAIAHEIKQSYPNQKINFITNQNQLTLLSENFSAKSLREENLTKNPASEQQFLILENKFFYPDPILSQQAYSTDKNLSEFNIRKENEEKIFETEKASIKSSEKFPTYSQYWQNDIISVYKSN